MYGSIPTVTSQGPRDVVKLAALTGQPTSGSSICASASKSQNNSSSVGDSSIGTQGKRSLRQLCRRDLPGEPRPKILKALRADPGVLVVRGDIAIGQLRELSFRRAELRPAELTVVVVPLRLVGPPAGESKRSALEVLLLPLQAPVLVVVHRYRLPVRPPDVHPGRYQSELTAWATLEGSLRSRP